LSLWDDSPTGECAKTWAGLLVLLVAEWSTELGAEGRAEGVMEASAPSLPRSVLRRVTGKERSETVLS
jgi:hypothetical protein